MTWTAARRAKFLATLAKKKLKNGHDIPLDAIPAKVGARKNRRPRAAMPFVALSQSQGWVVVVGEMKIPFKVIK